VGSFAEHRVVLESSHNFRDLGGYPTADGRVTRRGRIYRSDTLHLLSPADVEVLGRLGLRTVIDLRSAHELEHHGPDRFDEGTVDHWHVPLIDRVVMQREPRPVPRDAAEVYGELLHWGASGIARCFELLAEPDAVPAVFHCAVGKDRTGVIAALLLSLVGVPDEDVIADYALSAQSWPGRERFLAEHAPAFLDYLRAIPDRFLGSTPETMRTFLDGVRHDHGSARDYLTGIGVSAAALQRLHAALLEG
jgi:protein-tyrosine phosphatase